MLPRRKKVKEQNSAGGGVSKTQTSSLFKKTDQPSVELEVRNSGTGSKTDNADQDDRNTASDSNSSGGMVADPDKVQQLCGMGFSEGKAKDALITCWECDFASC